MKEEKVERIARLSDMRCSSHASLRDSYRRRALALDLGIMALATWLTAMAFIEGKLGAKLAPFGWEREIWLGVLSVGTFFLTIAQTMLDWKGKADAHARAGRLFAVVKAECRRAEAELGVEERKRVQDRYEFACEAAIEIPEDRFLSLKQHHKRKIALSRYLDEHPAASLTLTKLRWWIRDNLKSRGKN